VTAMDTDKIKIFGARVKVDGTGKLAELERAEKVCRAWLSPPCDR
jgi:T-complex protein 1 subunit beta